MTTTTARQTAAGGAIGLRVIPGGRGAWSDLWGGRFSGSAVPVRAHKANAPTESQPPMTNEDMTMPARLSNARKAAAGTLRPARVRQVPAGDRLLDPPKPPAGLSKAAADEWKRLAAALVEVGTLTRGDLRALQLLSETLAAVADLAATIAKEGFTVAGVGGGVKSHPCLVALAQARAQSHRMLADFGLTPRARGGVDQAPDSTDDDADPAARYFT